MGAFILIILLLASSALSQTSTLNRDLEPVIMGASSFQEFLGTPIEHLHLYAYRADTRSWELIPFQIDEVGEEEFYGGDDGVLDADPGKVDELVFMAKDVGDWAAPENWIEDPEARSYPRYEIKVVDGTDETRKGWVYLYKSSTISAIPPSYMSYDSTADRVFSPYYEVGYNDNGTLVDVVITKEGGGNGADIVDRQKQRFEGKILYFLYSINEDSLKKVRVDHRAGPVRVIRRIKSGLIFFGTSVDTVPSTARFYPYSMVLVGGGKKNLEPWWGVRLLRQSLDFNQNATGMKFYSNRNPQGILVDGTHDPEVDHSLDLEERNWAMITGPQGTIITINEIPPIGASQQLYFWDDASGKTFDGTPDTGDSMSYGDTGILIKGRNISGELRFASTTFFLPANLSPDYARHLCDLWEHPLNAHATEQVFTSVREVTVSAPLNCKLWPNYPNPFNSQTVISFELPHPVWVKLHILDTSGRRVITLVDEELKAGKHNYIWQGRDQGGQPVASGLYLYSLRAGGFKAQGKMILLR